MTVFECPDCGVIWTTAATVRPIRSLPPYRTCTDCERTPRP